MQDYFSCAKCLLFVVFSFVAFPVRANADSENARQVSSGVIPLVEKIRNLSGVNLCDLPVVSKLIGTSVIVDGTDRRSSAGRGENSPKRFTYIREMLAGYNPRVRLYIDDGYGGRASCELRFQRESLEEPALRLADLEPLLVIRPQYIATASSHLIRPPYFYELLDPKFRKLKVEIEVAENGIELISVRRK